MAHHTWRQSKEISSIPAGAFPQWHNHFSDFPSLSSITIMHLISGHPILPLCYTHMVTILHYTSTTLSIYNGTLTSHYCCAHATGPPSHHQFLESPYSKGPYHYLGLCPYLACHHYW